VNSAATSCQPGRTARQPSDRGRTETLARALHETHWNKSEAPTRLGLSRTQLYTRIRKHGLVQAMAYGGADVHRPSGPDQYESLMDFGLGEAHSPPATRVKGRSQRDGPVRNTPAVAYRVGNTRALDGRTEQQEV
jgi:hypothetical protein